MKISLHSAGRPRTVATGLIAIALVLGPAAAFAQQQGPHGTTSGPSAGSTVEPSTTAQKRTGSHDSKNTSKTSGQAASGSQGQQGGVGVGAPGVQSAPGAESGSTPGPGQRR